MRPFIKFAPYLFLGLSCFSCRTVKKDAETKSGQDILDIQRINNDYLITCLDGSTQKIPANSFDTVANTDICGNVLTSECLPNIKYSNGQALKLPGGSYNYSTGRPLKISGTIYFSNEKKQVFRTPSGVFYYSDGVSLRSNDGTFSYPSGQPLKKNSGTYYYPLNKPLKQPNGTILYPNGNIMKTAATNTNRADGGVQSPSSFNYSNGFPMKTASGSFFYLDQKQGRIGNILYRPDKSISATPLLFEEKVVDSGGDEFGKLRFAVETNTDSFTLSLPRLTPEVGMLFEPKSAEFKMRFQLSKNEAPLILTFDEKGQPRLYIFVSTGYKGERIVLFGSTLTGDLQCRAMHVND